METERKYGRLEIAQMRSMWIDILRALLIISVVVGHSNVDARIIQIIFWFHMPLFFMLSGYLLRLPEKSGWNQWIRKKAKRLLIPCFFFFLLCTLIDRNFSISSLACFIMGGKRQAGVYWFATVLFLAYFFISVIELHIHSNKFKTFIYVGCYCFAVAESIILIPSDTALIPNWLKLPWNIDVVPLAMAYLMTGYYARKHIESFIKQKSLLFKGLIVGISLIIFGVFVYLCWNESFGYHLDMKNGHYANPLFALLIPLTAVGILGALAVLLSKVQTVNRILAYVGSATMPIMYLHIAIIGHIMQRVNGGNYPIILCVVIVLVISCIFQWLCERNRWLRFMFSGK